MQAIASTAVAPTTLGRRLVANTLAQIVTPALRMALGIALTAALSRYLGVEGLGEYALVFAYVAAFNGIFNDWGLATICVREISQRPDQRESLLASAAALQAIVALASYGLMLGGLLLMHHPTSVNQAIALYGLMLLLTPLDVLALSFQADLRLAKLLPPSLLGVALNFVLIMSVILMKGPLVALVGAALAALLIQYAWITRLSLTAVRFTSWPTTAHWRPFLRESWPLGVTAVFSTAMQQAPILVLSRFSLQAAGLFSAANRIPMQLFMIPFTVRTSTFPLLSQSWVTDRAQFARRLDRLVRGGLLLSVPAAILGIGLAEPVVRLLFGPAFAGAALPFALLMATFGVLFPGILVGEALTAAGFQRLNLVIQIVAFPVLAVLLLVLVPAHGAAGAAWALLSCYAGITAATFAAARWRLGSAGPAGALPPAAAAATLGGGTLVISSPLGPVLPAMLGATVALATLLCIRPSQARELWSLLLPAKSGDQ